PDVQLNAAAGEVYCLGDLLHAMMMQSYNDVAVAVAEYVADVYVNGNQNHEKVKERTPDESRAMVKTFAILMNKKAEELGCVNTYFITPNGLDAQDENGIHSTTAYELAKICAYAVANEKVIEICTTKSYYFTELNGKRQVNIGTTDRFLDMMDGAVGLKTGFTGNAGYCFAGALKRDGKTLITVVLGCGWPPNKNYKWADTRILMNYGLNKFFFQKIFIADNNYREISVKDGVKENLGTYIPFSLDMLIGEMDRVDIIYTVPDYVKAPITVNQEVGKVNIYINDKLFTCFPVLAKESVEEKDYFWCVNYVIKLFFK
ncbi:MAG: D-alanyl-D-alanine carboxypeptidase family protein, partial [Butyrivibrio sp.]